MIPCPIKLITEHDCPGCGIQRSVFSLLDLDFKNTKFKELNILGGKFFAKTENTKIEHFPAKALILNVTSGCNLSCTYCYKADLTSLKNGGQMTFEIAKKWTMPIRNWGKVRGELEIMYPDRMQI